ncbi:MAG: septal ring lytic transglycosylase RlpA family protein, partial [Treponema sp.]|nr:septal ring lytic transglycosylase RlpA family protein [Treponema sp.]
MKHSTMKITGFFTPVPNMLLLTLLSLSLIGASVWEGAAALAPRGDLPEEGYYAATNSFPQNTVVDITNLETGRSIRAIVSSGLNTPGLLAVLSPDAAGRIGLGTKTIGRIRMTQPEDPIAFSRFTEGLVASGDPDYDPAAMLAVEQNAARAPEPEEPAPSTVRPVREEAEVRSDQNPASYHYDSPGAARSPDYADYSQNSIVSVAGSTGNTGIPQERIDDNWEEDWDDLSYSGSFPDDEDSPERSSYLIWERGGSVGKTEIRETGPVPQNEDPAELSPRSGGTGPAIGLSGAGESGNERDDPEITEAPPPADIRGTGPVETPSGDPWEDAWREDGNSQTRIMAEAQSSARSSGNESIAEARIVIRQPEPVAQAPVQNAPGTVEYILVPAEERPPVPGPEPELRGPEVDPLSPPAAAQEPQIDESLFIDPIEKTRENQAQAAEEAARAAEAARLAEERRAAKEAARAAEAARLAEEQRAAEEAARAAESARLAEERRAAKEAARAAEAARVAEEQRVAEEAARAAEAARLAEERRAAETERPEVTVLLPREEGEPGGPWVDPVAELPPPPPERTK